LLREYLDYIMDGNQVIHVSEREIKNIKDLTQRV
jgi:hypothetical protein